MVLSRAGEESEEIDLVAPTDESAESLEPGLPEPLSLSTPSDVFDAVVEKVLASEPDRSALGEALADVKSTLSAPRDADSVPPYEEYDVEPEEAEPCGVTEADDDE